MDKNSLLSRLNKAIPEGILDSRPFGRSGLESIWVEGSVLHKVASTLKNWNDVKFDWLENLSVVEFEGILVFSYFLRSHFNSQSLIIRASAAPESPHAVVLFPSVRKIWSMAEPMEREASELFGIHFQESSLENTWDQFPFNNLLPEGWEGFPLRKNYVFPQKFLGITHARSNPILSQKKPIHL